MSTSTLRILLVDDDPMSRRLWQRLLERLGYQTELAGDGQAALECLEQQRYDLVFMDVHMPVMDGLEATRQICQRWGDVERPIIVGLTVNMLPENRQAGLEAGMDAYLGKPSYAQELQAIIERGEALRAARFEIKFQHEE